MKRDPRSGRRERAPQSRPTPKRFGDSPASWWPRHGWGRIEVVTTTIYELLDELRRASLDERDKGDKFERLVRAYLLSDPQWVQRFTDVWLWSDWPGRQGRPDTGIDL